MLSVQTRNTLYTLSPLDGGSDMYLISGHHKYCPAPIEAQIAVVDTFGRRVEGGPAAGTRMLVMPKDNPIGKGFLTSIIQFVREAKVV